MNRIITMLFIGLITCPIFAQDKSVQKSIYGVQTGFLGIWMHTEIRLSPKIALRTELGFDSGILGGAGRKTSFLFTPVLTAEPRWYYNIAKRASKAKSTSNNSANFISLKTSFNPDWFIISSENNKSVDNQISIVPTWGIKRPISSKFTYETGFGIGYKYYLNEPKIKTIGERTNVAVNLHLRIGYIF